MKKTIGLLLLMSTSLFAREIGLEEAIDLALGNSKEMQISEKGLKKSKLELNRALKSALPSIVYTGSYLRSQYDRDIIINQKPKYRKISENENAKGGFNQKITLSQPIFQGGAIIGGVQYANAMKDIADLSYLASKRDVRLEVIKVYSSIVKEEKNLATLNFSRQELEKTYQRQKEKRKLRLTTNSDVLKTEYNILELDSKIIGSKNTIKIQKETLRLKLGLGPKEDITVVNFNVPRKLSDNIDFDKDLQKALTQSIDYKIANQKINIANAEKNVARADLLPKVNAFVSYGVESDRRKIRATLDDAEWRAGVQVSWNVFEFGKGIDNYRESILEKEQEKLREELTKDSINIKVTDAYLELVRMEKERESKTRALEAAKENYDIDKAKYQAGIISTIDYLISEKQLREANLGYNQVIIDYLYAYEKYRSLLI